MIEADRIGVLMNPQLRELEVERSQITDGGLVDFICQVRTSETLRLGFCPKQTDQSLEALVASRSNIQRLRVGGALEVLMTAAALLRCLKPAIMIDITERNVEVNPSRY